MGTNAVLITSSVTGKDTGHNEILEGSAIPLGGGIFITAAHLYSLYYSNDRFGIPYDKYFTSGGNIQTTVGSVPFGENQFFPSGNWFPENSLQEDITHANHDLAWIKQPLAMSVGPLSPVVAFADDNAFNAFVNNALLGKADALDARHTHTTGAISGPAANGEFLDQFSTLPEFGDSGGPVSATIKNTSTNYVIGVHNGLGPDGSLESYISTKLYYTATKSLIAGSPEFQSIAPDILYGKDPEEHIRGSARRANIITNGDDNTILAGSGGGLVNTGTGQGDVIFLPASVGQDDPGTTVVVSPGTTILSGGGANDKLVLLADRLTPDGTSPDLSTLSDHSDTIQLKGGWAPIVSNSDSSDGNGTTLPNSYFETSLLGDGDAGKYKYDVTYQMINSDLIIVASSGSWNGAILLKDFKPGDFGLTLMTDELNQSYGAAFDQAEKAAMTTLLAGTEAQSYVNDNPSVDWTGEYPWSYYGGVEDTLEANSSGLTDRLAAVLSQTADLMSGQPDPDPNAYIALAAGATLTVTASNKTVIAGGAGSTINFVGASEVASISSGTINLLNGASATINGDSNFVTFASNGSANIVGLGGIVTVAGTNNVLTVNDAVISLQDAATATVRGTGSTVTIGNNTGLDVSSATRTIVKAAGINETVFSAANEIDLQAGAKVQVIGDGNSFKIGSGGILIATGGNSSLSLSGTNDQVSVNGTGASINVTGTSHGVSSSAAAFTMRDGSTATVQGVGNTISVGSNVGLDVSSASNTVIKVTGTNSTVFSGAGEIDLQTGAKVQVIGDGNSFNVASGGILVASGDHSSLSLSGTNDQAAMSGSGTSVEVTGTGHGITVSAASLTLHDGATTTVHGNSNHFNLGNNTGLDTSSGVGCVVNVDGSNVQIFSASGEIDMNASSSAQVIGDGDTLKFNGPATVSVSGNSEAFIFEASPGTSSINGYNATDNIQFSKSTFADFAHVLSNTVQQGSDTIIHTDANHSLTLNNTIISSLSANHFSFV